MNYIDIIEAKEVYRRGQNVTKYLRDKFNLTENTSEIIELAYELQTGSYIKIVEENIERAIQYAKEVGNIFSQYVNEGDSLIDVGAGELTRLTLMLNSANIDLSNVYAFDISWSRLKKGKEFFTENKRNKNLEVKTFVADIKAIPLPTSCVDIVTSHHALEPNGQHLPQLLKELFRVAKRKLILFEPSYELNSIEGQQRMDSLGYIKGLEEEVLKLGGTVETIVPIKNATNPLCPTTCYVILPSPDRKDVIHKTSSLSVPGTDLLLHKSENFLMSKDTGLVFPILEDIPILKMQSGILATAKF